MNRNVLFFFLALSIGVHLGLLAIRFDGDAPNQQGLPPVTVHLFPSPATPLNAPEGFPSAPSPISAPPITAAPPPEAPSNPPPLMERAVPQAASPQVETTPLQEPPSEILGMQSPLSPPLPQGESPQLPNTASTSPSHATFAPSPISAPVLTRAEPRYEENPPPPYPRMALRQGWEGTVWLEVHVSAAGAVTDLRVERSSGRPVLDRAAMNAVSAWRFHPARLGREAVEEIVIVPVEFKLQF